MSGALKRDEWETVRLGEVCEVNPSKKFNTTISDELPVGFLPMEAVSNDGDILRVDSRKYGEVKKGFSGFQDGDVLIAKITPCMENGKGALVSGMPSGIGFGSTEFHVLRPDSTKCHAKYIFHILENPLLRQDFARKMTGSAGQRRLPKNVLQMLEIPLPPLDVQRRIAETLDKVTELISLRKTQLGKLDELVKARFVEMFIGKGYPTKTVNDISLGKGEYGAQSASVVYDPARPRYVRITDIMDDGTLNNDVVSSINPNDDEQYKLEYGDFMFARMGATVGKTYAFIDGNQIFAGYLIRYRLNRELIHPRYLFWYTKMDEYWNWVTLNQSGAAQPGINAKKYGSLQIPLPPINEQNTFASFVSSVEEAKAPIQQSLDTLETLKKSLMQEYFG